MLSVNDLRKVTWHRLSAPQSYTGYLVVTDTFVRLFGREESTGIDATLTIPHTAIHDVSEAEAGALELHVADGVPILVRPVGGELELTTLARRLLAASA